MYKKSFILFILLYYLGIHNGHLAIFQENDPAPLLVFPNSILTYNEADKRSLEQGIVCDDSRELTRILEDFLS